MNGFWTGEGAAPKRKNICCQSAIATLMQPLHYDLQRPAAKKWSYSITSAAVATSNLDATITVRSAPASGNTWQHACIYAQPNWSTIPQTAHCDLRGANLGTTSIAATTSRASCPSSPAATTGRTPWRNQKRPKRAWPQPLHTRAALHCRLRPLYAKKRSFSCPGILLNTSPMQRARSHYNAFCTATWQTCMYLFIWQQNMTTIIQQFHCDLQPQIPKHFLTTHTRTHPKHLDTTVTLRQ